MENQQDNQERLDILVEVRLADGTVKRTPLENIEAATIVIKTKGGELMGGGFGSKEGIRDILENGNAMMRSIQSAIDPSPIITPN